MAEPLKNYYNEKFFNSCCEIIATVEKGFNKKQFLREIYANGWEDLELKERMRHVSTTLNNHLTGNYKKQVTKILKMTQLLLKNKMQEQGLQYMFLPDFIEQYGQDDYETSVKAMEKITVFTSCEFGVRPFILKYPAQMMQQFLLWSKHDNLHVRRFASEGSRPRLPWAMGIPALKADPKPILPILKNLKNDPSEYVRRSVANNLNDISKDHPVVVINIAKSWMNKKVETQKLIKHACRTLLKQGNAEVMELFGFGNAKNIKIENLKIQTPKIKIGEALVFNFDLKNTAATAALVRLEYAVYYQKSNGTLSKKVYKISEKQYSPKSSTPIEKKQSFRQITTRVFHKGLHQVAIVVNGVEGEKFDFKLV